DRRAQPDIAEPAGIGVDLAGMAAAAVGQRAVLRQRPYSNDRRGDGGTVDRALDIAIDPDEAGGTADAIARAGAGRADNGAGGGLVAPLHGEGLERRDRPAGDAGDGAVGRIAIERRGGRTVAGR